MSWEWEWKREDEMRKILSFYSELLIQYPGSRKDSGSRAEGNVFAGCTDPPLYPYVKVVVWDEIAGSSFSRVEMAHCSKISIPCPELKCCSHNLRTRVPQLAPINPIGQW